MHAATFHIVIAKQDQIHAEELNQLRREKRDAIIAADELQSKFEETEKQNERLAYSRKDEIDPYDIDQDPEKPCFLQGFSGSWFTLVLHIFASLL